MLDLFGQFEIKEEIKSPRQLVFKEIGIKTALICFDRWHYLGNGLVISSINYGAYFNGEIEGAICFGPTNATEFVDLWDRDSQLGWWEIKRLAMSERCPKNSESRFIGKTIKMLKLLFLVKGIVTYADTSQNHTGVIYRATGFRYLGLTKQKNDFVVNGKIKQRGKTKGIDGVWVKRSLKHVYIKEFANV
jgi:hypothetical protein